MLSYYNDALSRHYKVIANHGVDQNAPDIWLPPINQDFLRVMNVLECDRVEVAAVQAATQAVIRIRDTVGHDNPWSRLVVYDTAVLTSQMK